MKKQSFVIFALLSAILLVIFAIRNVTAVKVNMLFTTVELPLIVVISFSVFIGAITVGLFAYIKTHRLKAELKRLEAIAEAQENGEYRSRRQRYRKRSVQ